MKRKNFIILIVVAVMVTGSPAKSDTRPTGDPGGGAVVPHEGSKVGTEGRRSEVTLTLHGVPVQVFIEVKGPTGDGWLHLAAGDGTSETFLMSTPADLDLSEVTGSPSLTLHLREETESESEIVEGDIKHSSSSSDGREATRLVPVPHQKDDLQHFEHQGYHSSPPEHQGYHSSPPEHQINDLPLDKRQENSIRNIATIPILTSPLKCPTFTPLMSPNTDPDIKTSAYELNCKVTPEGRLYDVTHTFDTPGRYQLAAYYEERASGSTRWRQEMTVVVEELLQVVLGPNTVLELLHGSARGYASLYFTPAHAHPSFTPPSVPAQGRSLCPEGPISWAWTFAGRHQYFGEEDEEEEEQEEDEDEAEEEKEEKVREEMLLGTTGRRAKLRDKDVRGETEDSGDNLAGSGDGSESYTERRSESYVDKAVLSEKQAEKGGKVEKRRDERSSKHLVEIEETVDGGRKGILVENWQQLIQLKAPTTTTTSTTTTTTTPTTTTTTTTTSTPTSTTTSITVNHTFHQPGTYDFRAQVLCNGVEIVASKIDNAFLVVSPIAAVEISSSHTVVPLQQVTRQATAAPEVTLTVTVGQGSHLEPLTFDLGDGSTLHLPPTLLTENGNWVAQVQHTYTTPGDYLPRVQVSNPVGSKQAVLSTPIQVQLLPTTVWLEPETLVRAAGEVVTFQAYSPGTHLRYDWVLPGNESLQDAGPTVSRVYGSAFTDFVSVSVHNDALDGLVPPRPRPKGSGLVTVKEKLQSAVLLVGKRSRDVIIQRNELTLLEVEVTPAAAAANHQAYFLWVFSNSAPQSSQSSKLEIRFRTVGSVLLHVEVNNSVSFVKSQDLNALVVDKIQGVRGLAAHDSILKGQIRSYTVLVDQGSHITYVWDFGDNSTRANTTKPTKTHTYHSVGTYTLTVTLTSPLGDTVVASSSVFVLEAGICDTPKVLQFWPKDVTASRQYDGTQEVLVEPELLRRCPLGSGPKYGWRLWNQDGKEIYVYTINSPTLLLHPIYDESFTVLGDLGVSPQQPTLRELNSSARDFLPTSSRKEPGTAAWQFPTSQAGLGITPRHGDRNQHQPTGSRRPTSNASGDGSSRQEQPHAVPERRGASSLQKSLEDGKYLVQLTIQETDTHVEASFNTTFSISAIRLKVVFMDGTERDVDANSNITLRVEVTAPTPNYTLEWACRLAADPDSGCFTDPDPWDTFTATRRVADRLVVRLWHIWDILHDDDGDGSRGLHPSSVTTTTYADEDTNTLRYKASPSENTLPRAAAARAWTASPLWKRAHTAKIPLSKRSSVKYIETISFPASSLLRGEDKFIVSVSCRYHLMASSDQQLIVIQSPRDSVGILSHLGTQFPFGAARRIVFESECMSCSPQELSSLSYSWHLKMIYEGPELEATTRAREGKEDSKDMALLEAIRQGRSGKGFLPRPRDYLRAYNATFAQAPLYQSVQREEDEDSLLSYTQYFNARDLQKLEGLVTPDMAARALEMESRWKEARQSSHKREKGQTGTHTFGRLKRSVQSPSLQRGWGRSGEKNTGGSGRASPSTHHPGDAQHHQMKDHHRTSSTQTNKRRGVVGRQLSLWTRGEDRAHDTTSLDPLPITSAEVVPRNDWEARKEEVPDSSWNAIKGTSAMAHRNMERKDSRKLQQVEAGSLPPPLYPHAERVNSGNSGRKFQTQEGMFSARQNVADKDTRLAYADGGGRGRSRSNERLEQLQAAGKVQDILQLHSHEMIPHGGRANDFERKELHKEEKDVERVSGGNRGEMLRQMNEGNHGGRDDQPGGGSEKRKKWRQMIVSGGGRGEAQARVTTEDPDEGVSFASTLSNSQVTERGDSGPDKESREDLRRAGVTQVTVEVGGGSPGNAVTPLNPPSEQPANARLIHQSGGEDAERAGGTTSAPWSTDAAAGAPHSSPSRPPKLPPSLARPTPFPPSDTSPAITPSLQVDKEQEERLSPASDDHSAREDEWSGLSALHQSRLEPEQEKEDTEQSEKIILVTEDKPVLMKSQGRKRWINRRGKKDKGRMERPKLEATPNKKKLEERDKEQQTENRWPVTTLSHEEEEAGYKENHLTFGADVNGGEKEAVEESDTEEEKSGVGAGRLGRINRQSTHQRHDSAHMPIRVAPSKGAPIRLSDQFVHGGVKGAAGATERKASMQRVLTVLLPDQSGVFDYKKYKKDNAAQLSRRQTSPNSSSESDLKGGRNVEDRLKQAASSKGRPRSGGDEISSNLTTGDGIAVSHIPEDAGARAGLPSRRLAGEREDQFTQRQKGSVNNDADKEKQESRGWWNAARGAGGEVGRSPLSSISTSRPRPLTSVEGRVESIRGVGYHKAVRDYAATHQDVPNLSCRPERWKECASASPRAHIFKVLNHTIGTLGDGTSRLPTDSKIGPLVIESEKAQIDVHFFWELTSTGTHEPVLVLYTDYLKTKARYLLYLNTYNSITNNSGLATQLIEFSPPPSVENCRITPLPDKNGAWFRGSCDEVHGHYNPVLLQWSYSFLSLDTGTVLSQGFGTKFVFYHGARPFIDFPLPSGLESKDYNVHVSIKAIDGKGVSYKYPPVMNLIIYPRCNTGDGILSLFQEIPTIQNESPSLLLQQVRTLAWELNVMKYCDMTQTIFDNILTILFYKTSCKDILQPANASPYNSEYSFQDNKDFFVKVNLLKSCARDHLTKIVADLPVRDEMEVVQVLTALQNLVDNDELISSKTYSRVIISMHTVARRMMYTYNPEVKAEAVEQYFVLSSAVLDKQSDIYDGNTTSVQMSNTVISLILDVMGRETKTRFREEQPLVYFTETLKYQGFLADAENINRWNHSLSFIFEPNSVPDGVHLVQSLEHKQSPYNITKDPITSEVVNIDLHVPSSFLRQVKVKVERSVLRNGNGYNFQLPGLLTAQFLSVYEFMVNKEHDSFALHILLHITKVLNPDYPVAAILLICNDMQSLKEPIYKQEVMAANEPSQVSLFIPPAQLPYGKLLLIIMDKNSYTNNRARYNSSDMGANFLVSGWWSQCLVWGDTLWHHQNCSVIGEESSWDYTTCSCKSHFSVYGAQSIPILGDESKVEVNKLMLHETYLALYFMLLLLLVYFILALALQTSDRHRLRRRNIWLRDNKPDHEYAYLLTIKTGTQWNAGTTARVYAILHGTHGMSETRELQSQQTGQLFTRGALCTFILTTAEQLGDILKVQVWHDNSGGSESGWYVCETSVADLVHGARYAYPCYRWLSVQAEDAKIEREITLESPTTFLQDFEHFLPQYASEHMLWTSLLTTSSTAKLYRLQRVTICLIVCLCMGTVSLSVVQKINSDHTMMVPDMHIESLYYGAFIAMLLLPVQWLLEMVFKMSNRLEEKEYNAKTVLDTLRATKEMVGTPTANDIHENCQEETDKVNGDDIYDINAQMWRNLTGWAQDIDLPDLKSDVLHPALLQREENTQITQRSRKNTGTEARNNSVAAPPSAALPTSLPNLVNDDHETANAKKCSPIILNFFSELRKTFNYIVHFVAKNKRGKMKKRATFEEEGWGLEEDKEDDDDMESDELRVTSSITFIFSQCFGWIVCCLFAAMCCMVLFVRGSGMPMDYGSLWIHIMYITLCSSVFIMQPLVVVIYTLYKVCMYRWLGCRGCISSCVTVPLEQVVAIWNRYQTVLLEQVCTAKIMDREKLLEERQRTRYLRYAHPPSEDYLLKCREKELRKERVSNLFCSTTGHLLFLILLIIIASSVNVKESYRLNRAIFSALENGTCLESARYLDTCKTTGTDKNSCNQAEDINYMRFKDIKNKNDWWKWANSELLALTYNSDQTFSKYNNFCDLNSVIIGTPRIRKYDIGSEECQASKVKIGNNRSMADLLRVKTCFPDYVDQVAHLYSFGSNIDRGYKWDAHFLAVTYGQFGHYSYTVYQKVLPSSRLSSILTFIVLQSTNWIDENKTRAVVTDFTLYHPQTRLYTTIALLAEFPSLSGVKLTTNIWSTHIERYNGRFSAASMMAEILLLAVAMRYLYQTTIYVYTCRFRIWKSFWGILDVLMTVASWSYVVCLMLRVQIAEDALWQLRVAYFQKFVNLKSLATWDDILEAMIGVMMMLHILRCLCLMQYLPRLRCLLVMVASAAKDVFIISIVMCVLVIACSMLGHMWFSHVMWECHTLSQTALTLFGIAWAHFPFMKKMEDESSGYTTLLGYLYYLITYVFLYQVGRSLYIAAFLNVRKLRVNNPGLDVKWEDISYYVKQRSQTVLRKVFLKKDDDDESQPKDNTPPDFYMTELDLQISQVMAGLEDLAETLGLVVKRMDRLLDEDQSTDFDMYNSDGVSEDTRDDAAWQPEVGCNILRPFQSSLEEAQEDADGGKQLPFCNVNTSRKERLENTKFDERSRNSTPHETSFNLDAFTDIASCHTEIEALARNWNLNSTTFEQRRYGTEDDGGRLAKFLKDVSAASDESVTSFGKYGKTVSKLKVNPKLHPSHESLTTVQNLYCASTASDTTRTHHLQSLVTSHQQRNAIQSNHIDMPAQSLLGVSSRLCRTQTQGRGKGHVDVLDIISLESDSDSET